MKITPLQQYLTIGVLALGVILFGYYQYLWKPVVAQINQLTTTRDQKKKDLEEAKRIVARYAEFKKQAATVLRELEWFETRVPKKLEPVRFVEALNAVQRRSGVKLTNLSFPQTKPTGTAYVEIPATVRFNTNFQGLMSFLYRMTLAEIYLVPDDINIVHRRAAADESGRDTITVQMMVKGVALK
jgi:Tfp pilus assembly protein PilO